MSHPPRLALIATLLLGVAACASSKPDRPPDHNRIQEGHAPTPFTATELRRGCRSGRVVRLRLWTAGKPPAIQVWRFFDASPTDARIEKTVTDESGAELGAPELVTMLWSELQGRASFPDAATEIETVQRATPIGHFECWMYTVRRQDGVVERYWFAKSLPGPPIEYGREEGGELVARQTMIESKY